MISKRTSPRPYTYPEIQRATVMFIEENMTLRQVAARLGRTPGSVSNVLWKSGVIKRRKRDPEELTRKIRMLAKLGKSASSISDELEIRKGTILDHWPADVPKVRSGTKAWKKIVGQAVRGWMKAYETNGKQVRDKKVIQESLLAGWPGVSRRERDVLEIIEANPGINANELYSRLDKKSHITTIRFYLRILANLGAVTRKLCGKTNKYYLSEETLGRRESLIGKNKEES